MAAWVLAALVVAVVATRLLGTGGGSDAGPPVRLDRGEAAPRRGGRGAEAYVHVAGAVRRPGLYRVPAGSRIAAALELAGGPARRAELAAVNLAARVQDGQQIVVPRAGSGASAATATAGGTAAGGKLSLATATAEQLDQLDGIGPTLAKRILEYRDSHGGFRSLGELRQVEGIGEKRFEALRGAVSP